jgi:hypothetical protein
MSLQIIFRPVRNVPKEVSLWLAESKKTIEVLKQLSSAVGSLEALQQDRTVMNLTVQLMTVDFTAFAEKIKDGDPDDLSEIRSLLLRTSDMMDGIVSMGVKVNEIAKSVGIVVENLTNDLHSKQPKL